MYNATTQNCTLPCGQVAATLTSLVRIAPNEDAMEAALFETGPMVVGVDASTWSDYTGGVFTQCNPSPQVDHTATLVGYNDLHDPPYWLIKNSWGVTWGENGYIRLLKGTNACGVNELVRSVTVEHDIHRSR